MNEKELREQRGREFEEAVKPLHEWLCKYGNPHMIVTVQQDGAQAYEGIVAASLPIPD